MSTVSPASGSTSPYQPLSPKKTTAAEAKPAPAPAPAAGSDADHDGDVDGKGLDVNG
ncbi:MAG TPA: hypothetical protein VH253_04375 [Phycisphaerae bacterium]|nr:hypothetical protein [Phycisphaerae bacterium]